MILVCKFTSGKLDTEVQTAAKTGFHRQSFCDNGSSRTEGGAGVLIVDFDIVVPTAILTTYWKWDTAMGKDTVCPCSVCGGACNGNPLACNNCLLAVFKVSELPRNDGIMDYRRSYVCL